ncbi:g6133 [Coccomyxa viridis]|uniref:G6133 protein n=1 Tax=Coccomyxa viridis TaxID=1274662 RepID=A0ABP1FX79_9CHLO
MSPTRKKLIIDTDPGIDDAMAILTAMNSEEVEVIGLTTVFGNVYTDTATKNAFKILEVAGKSQIPVAEGAHDTFAGIKKDWVPDFVHGDDGFGNMNFPEVQGVKYPGSAADFLIETVAGQPGEVVVLALGPLTNVALAMQKDPAFAENVGELVILGGAFFVNGNVNPATEANFFGDPEAADFVLSQPAKTRIVGLDITHSCTFTGPELTGLHGKGRFGTFLSSITAFYLKYHRDSYDMDAVYVHDPAALAVVLRPSLFTWRTGQIRVLTESVARGMSVMDTGLKRWNRPHAWTDRPRVQVAVAVNAKAVTEMLLQRMAL